jgi:hypothetical protein
MSVPYVGLVRANIVTRQIHCVPSGFAEAAKETAISGEKIFARCHGRGRIDRMVPFLLRAALTGVALWVVTLIVPGLSFVGGHTTLQKIGIVFVVAVIFGLVNAIIKPIVQIASIPSTSSPSACSRS